MTTEPTMPDETREALEGALQANASCGRAGARDIADAIDARIAARVRALATGAEGTCSWTATLSHGGTIGCVLRAGHAGDHDAGGVPSASPPARTGGEETKEESDGEAPQGSVSGHGHDVSEGVPGAERRQSRAVVPGVREVPAQVAGGDRGGDRRVEVAPPSPERDGPDVELFALYDGRTFLSAHTLPGYAEEAKAHLSDTGHLHVVSMIPRMRLALLQRELAEAKRRLTAANLACNAHVHVDLRDADVASREVTILRLRDRCSEATGRAAQLHRDLMAGHHEREADVARLTAEMESERHANHEERDRWSRAAESLGLAPYGGAYNPEHVLPAVRRLTAGRDALTARVKGAGGGAAGRQDKPRHHAVRRQRSGRGRPRHVSDRHRRRPHALRREAGGMLRLRARLGRHVPGARQRAVCRVHRRAGSEGRRGEVACLRHAGRRAMHVYSLHSDVLPRLRRSAAHRKVR